jgi:hypothetical protein
MATTRAARIATLDADIELTLDAIRRIVTGGQAYSAEGRVMTRADLGALRSLLASQRSERNQLARGNGARVYGVVHR